MKDHHSLQNGFRVEQLLQHLRKVALAVQNPQLRSHGLASGTKSNFSHLWGAGDLGWGVVTITPLLLEMKQWDRYQERAKGYWIPQPRIQWPCFLPSPSQGEELSRCGTGDWGLNQEKADEGVQAWSTAGPDPWVSVPKADIMSGSLRGPGSRSNPSLYRWANRPGTHPRSKDVKGRAGPRFRDSRPLCPKLLSPLPKHLPLLQ